MATLPTPGGDDGVWGDELNTWLQVEHAADGTHNLATLGIQPLDSDLTAIAALTTTSFGRGLLELASQAALLSAAGAQASDTELTALAGLTSAADKVPYFTGSGTAAVTDLTSAARTVLDDTSTSAMLTTLGAQPVDADLTALAGLTSAANKGIQFTGSGTAATYDLTAAGKALLDDADAAAQLVTLGAQPALVTENIQTDSYTLVLGDAGLRVVMNKGTAVNLTVPVNASVAFPVGTTIEVFQLGAGQVTFVMTSLTSQSPSGKLKLTGQYSSATLCKRATDTWSIAGDLSA